ncbi:hypothetical protein X798_03609 [Onchocerca flexuosa]|uniref:Uncharacterized protein n=1 Tax=Onchocerca flexuosa TaxID=387005 RepID=A0A238BV94_9BILA|nr:hypothetical protein X798_03609 [Onchocerca flexuosa]
MTDRPQSMKMIDRPQASSQLSAHNEQNPWHTRKRKNKKRGFFFSWENLDESYDCQLAFASSFSSGEQWFCLYMISLSCSTYYKNLFNP